MGLYKREQVFTIIAAVLFLIGAVFMLLATFSDNQWAVWTGLAFAVVAATLYVLLVLENRKIFSKKMTYPDTEANKDSHEKIESSKTKTTKS